MYGYDYPPSKHILAFGPLQEESHFYGTGFAEFEIGSLECEFEIAYTHDCRIVIICYFLPELERKALGDPVMIGNAAFDPQINLFDIKCSRLSGTEKRYGFK